MEMGIRQTISVSVCSRTRHHQKSRHQVKGGGVLRFIRDEVIEVTTDDSDGNGNSISIIWKKTDINIDFRFHMFRSGKKWKGADKLPFPFPSTEQTIRDFPKSEAKTIKSIIRITTTKQSGGGESE